MHTSRGIPQGSILGPLGFVLNFDDKSNYIDYPFFPNADDTKLATQNYDNLFQQTAFLQEWSSENHLKIQHTKSEILVFNSEANDAF